MVLNDLIKDILEKGKNEDESLSVLKSNSRALWVL